MKVTVIGCGNAFSHENGNQSFLIEEDGRKLIIDMGSRIPLQLKKLNIPLSEINDIYISHQHADHIGGLEEVAFSRYDWMNKPQHYSEGSYAPRLIANTHLLDELWSESLKGGLKSMEGFDSTLETFFETLRIKPNGTFEWQGWTVRLIQQIHVMTGSMIMPTFGLIFAKEDHKTIYFTTDSQHCSPRQTEIFYKEADVIFQDCETIGVDMSLKEGAKYFEREDEVIPFDGLSDIEQLALGAEGLDLRRFERFKFASGVHANYAQLAGYDSANSIKLPQESKGKMWLSHYQDFVNHDKDYKGNNVDWEAEAKADGFQGFIKVGQTFDF